MPKRDDYRTMFYPIFEVEARFKPDVTMEVLAHVLTQLATRTTEALSDKRVTALASADEDDKLRTPVTLRFPADTSRVTRLLSRPGGCGALSLSGQFATGMMQDSFGLYATLSDRVASGPVMRLHWMFVHKQGVRTSHMGDIIRLAFALLAQTGACVRAGGNFACTDERLSPDSAASCSPQAVLPTLLSMPPGDSPLPPSGAFPNDFVQLLTPDVLPPDRFEKFLATPALPWVNFRTGEITLRKAEVTPLANGCTMVAAAALDEEFFRNFGEMRAGDRFTMPLDCTPSLAWLFAAYHEAGVLATSMEGTLRMHWNAWAQRRREGVLRRIEREKVERKAGRRDSRSRADEPDEEALRVSLVRARLVEVKGRAPSFLKGRVLRGGSPDVVREGLSETPSAVWRIAEPGTTHAHTLWGAPSDYDMRFLSPVYVGSPRKDEALVVIDATRSGYDAIHKNIKPTKRGATRQLRCPKCWHDQFRLAVGLEYDADVLRDAGTTPAEELFSWLWLFAACPQCNWKKCVLDEECA